MPDSVLVLGGGVGGLTAAHELADRGFTVTVLERGSIPGGKARSLPAAGTGSDGRPDLPAEHGFRFFPGFYTHVPDTMKRIPFGSNANGVFDNLATATRAEIAQVGGEPLILPAQFPHSIKDLELVFHDAFHNDIKIPNEDKAHFGELLVKLLGSCEERRFGEYEYESWWTFSEADRRSPAYQKFLADGLTRTLVAAKAKQMSARTGGYILLQLLFDMSERGKAVDRVLNGPTNEVWIEPWLTHLRGLGVDYRLGSPVSSLRMDGSRVAAAVLDDHTELTADWFVAAVPVERMVRLVRPPMAEVEPRLSLLKNLVTRWMNGVLFYLHTDVPLVPGHVIYIDSPWALTSISQTQFWPSVDLTQRGDGSVHGILSVDVSDWETPSKRLGKPAMECSRDEVVREVWAQLKDHLGDVLPDEYTFAFVDPDIQEPNPHEDVNLEPLLVNTAGSWDDRPDAVTAIENLVLASDYVRTHTDLATMEGANEAARRAVNGILDAVGSKEPRCGVWPLHEPKIFKPIKALDRRRYEHEHRHK